MHQNKFFPTDHDLSSALHGALAQPERLDGDYLLENIVAQIAALDPVSARKICPEIRDKVVQARACCLVTLATLRDADVKQAVNAIYETNLDAQALYIALQVVTACQQRDFMRARTASWWFEGMNVHVRVQMLDLIAKTSGLPAYMADADRFRKKHGFSELPKGEPSDTPGVPELTNFFVQELVRLSPLGETTEGLLLERKERFEMLCKVQMPSDVLLEALKMVAAAGDPEFACTALQRKEFADCPVVPNLEAIDTWCAALACGYAIKGDIEQARHQLQHLSSRLPDVVRAHTWLYVAEQRRQPK